MLNMEQYFTRDEKTNLVVCDKCHEHSNKQFLFPHKQGLCILCEDCSSVEKEAGNMLEIKSPKDHPMFPNIPHLTWEKEE